ncbi:hypothetical protein ACG5V6_02280 [Streptomyces chitinivorans]|uniref:Uncharacterized protein n=1 Tax=Streptomyces chitinivorans TaxID=1257027 RepID=A0ABW7HMS1_9ACTN|nr:hypothetical protein [Streptomyces chitinivorans]MDH2411560.1 hypothetical protein [Streptomyces chitinivorans]
MEISFSSTAQYAGQGLEHTCGADLASVSRGDLCWYYFLGRLWISRSGVEIGPSWGWVPLFDAIDSVQRMMTFARGGKGMSSIYFTENQESIDFTRERDVLRLVPSYLDSELICSVEEFAEAGTDFIRGELRRVVSEYPPLVRNSHVREVARSVGLEDLGV